MNDSGVSVANLQEELALCKCYKGIIGYKSSTLKGVLHIKPKLNVLLLNVWECGHSVSQQIFVEQLLFTRLTLGTKTFGYFFLLKIPNPHERLPAVRNAVFLILTKIKVLQLCGSWHKSLSSSGQYQTLLTPKASMFVFNRNNQLFQDSSDYLGCQNITQRRSL